MNANNHIISSWSVTCCDDSELVSSGDSSSAAPAGSAHWSLLSSQGGEKPDWGSFIFFGMKDSMSDGLREASVPMTASAISAFLNCLFGKESSSSDSTNMGLFLESDSTPPESTTSTESSFSTKAHTNTTMSQSQWINCSYSSILSSYWLCQFSDYFYFVCTANSITHIRWMTSF